MIRNDDELQITIERIARLQAQLTMLRRVEANHANASGFIAEIDRMQLAVREYLSVSPAAL